MFKGSIIEKCTGLRWHLGKSL